MQLTWSLALIVMILDRSRWVPVLVRYRPTPGRTSWGRCLFGGQLVCACRWSVRITQQLGDSIQQGLPMYLYMVGMAFSAGLFESVGRWAGYRWLFPPRLPYDWKHAVAYGIGHGGFESAIFVGGMSLLNFLQGNALTAMTAEQVQEQFSGETLAQVMDARQLFAGLAWHEPLLAAVERLATMPFHIAMSLLVLLVFTRKQIRWRSMRSCCTV